MFQARTMPFSKFSEMQMLFCLFSEMQMFLSTVISNVLAVSLSINIIARFVSFSSVIVDLWNVLIIDLWNVLNRQTFVRMAPSRLSMVVRRNFSRRSTSTFCLYFLGCWRCNENGRSQPFLHKKCLSTQKFAPFYGDCHKNCTSFNKTTIMSLFYLARLANITASLRKKSCKRLRSRPKQSNPLQCILAFLTFSRWALIHINRTSIQSHTNNGFFKPIMPLFTQ